VIVPGAGHFFDGKEGELAGMVAKFLERVFNPANSDPAKH
jgi:alpha/beta superfamily hydrolase